MSIIDTYVTVAGFPRIDKDPDALLDYPFDWSRWLAPLGDTIASVVWVVDTGITKTTQSFTSVTATVWLSGGTIGTTYAIVCRITTAGGRTEDRTIYVRVKAR